MSFSATAYYRQDAGLLVDQMVINNGSISATGGGAITIPALSSTTVLVGTTSISAGMISVIGGQLTIPMANIGGISMGAGILSASGGVTVGDKLFVGRTSIAAGVVGAGTGITILSPVAVDSLTISNSSVGSTMGAITFSPQVRVDNVVLDNSQISTTAGTLSLSPAVLVEGTTASRMMCSTAGGLVSTCGVTSTEATYVAGATSNIQAQIDAFTAGAYLPTMVTLSGGATLTDLNNQFVIMGAAGTITLYSAVGNGGQVVAIKGSTSDNAIVIDGNAAETIDSALTVTMSGGTDTFSAISDGANWRTISRLKKHENRHDFLINCDASSSVPADAEGVVAAIGDVSAGACTVTLKSGIFNATPECVGTIADGSVSGQVIGVEPASATSIVVDCISVGSSDCTTYNATLMCGGR